MYILCINEIGSLSSLIMNDQFIEKKDYIFCCLTLTREQITQCDENNSRTLNVHVMCSRNCRDGGIAIDESPARFVDLAENRIPEMPISVSQRAALEAHSRSPIWQ